MPGEQEYSKTVSITTKATLPQRNVSIILPRSLTAASPRPDTPSCPAARRGKLSVSSATGASLSLLIHFRVIYKQVYHPPKGCTNPRADRCCQSPSKLLSPAGTALGSKGIVWSPRSPELCLSGATGDGRVKKVKQVQAQSLWRVGVICYPARTDTFPSDMARQMGGHSCNAGNRGGGIWTSRRGKGQFSKRPCLIRLVLITEWISHAFVRPKTTTERWNATECRGLF